MIAIAKASDTEREVLFGNAADRAGISNPAIVEKDFWVCFALDYRKQKKKEEEFQWKKRSTITRKMRSFILWMI